MRFSVIMPVYNRESYLTRSIGSVLRQDYTDWELILVDDGSTDGSYETCLSYQSDDKRIRCIHQENSGAGAARNVGIYAARGDYLLFLDSDDWYEPNCLAEISRAIDAFHPDIVTFFMRAYHYDGTTSIPKRLIMKQGEITNERKCVKLTCRLLDIACAYDRRMLERENIIYLSGCFCEDLLFWFLSRCCAQSVTQIPYVLYNYDKRTMGISRSGSPDIVISANLTIIKAFETRGLLKDFGKSLGKALIITNKFLLFQNAFLLSEDESNHMETEIGHQIKIIAPRVYNTMKKRYLVWGSYTLRSAVNSLVLNQCKNVIHFQFSSIEAALQNSPDERIFEHKNSFRQKMVEHELHRSVLLQIEDGNFDYLIIDLLEERFDLLESDGKLLTDSDAFAQGSFSTRRQNMRRIIRTSEEAEKLFCFSLRRLRDALGEHFDMHRIVLVENYLMEGYGDFGEEKKFDNIPEIRETNIMLRHYYKLFKREFQNVSVVTPDRTSPSCFTDIEYRHGCFPWHSVEAWELDIADLIAQAIE